jgi:hypothetical protein
MLPVMVLKFGSSVLAGPKDLPEVVDEMYRHLREGKLVLAGCGVGRRQTITTVLGDVHQAVRRFARAESGE